MHQWGGSGPVTRSRKRAPVGISYVEFPPLFTVPPSVAVRTAWRSVGVDVHPAPHLEVLPQRFHHHLILGPGFVTMMMTLIHRQLLQLDARSGPVLLIFPRLYLASDMPTLFPQPLPLVFPRLSTMFPLPLQLNLSELTTHGQP